MNLQNDNIMRILFTSIIAIIIINLSFGQNDCTNIKSLKWSTYQGGNGDDEVMDIYVDPDTEYIYTINRTNSTDLLGQNLDGSLRPDLGDPNFVTLGDPTLPNKTYIQCMDPAGQLRWATLISGLENPYSIVTDDNDNVILLGVTTNPNMPGDLSVPGNDKTLDGESDLIFLKLNPNGDAIIASEFIGGNGEEVFTEDLTNFSYHGDKIYSVCKTTSTDISPSPNALSQAVGQTYIFVYNSSTYSYEYQSYYEYADDSSIDPTSKRFGSDAITVDEVGNLYMLLWNQGLSMSETSHYITPNALQPSYGNGSFNYPPLLFRLNNNFDVEYCSYLYHWDSENLLYGVDINFGFVDRFNYDRFDIEVDANQGLVINIKGQGFKSPVVSNLNAFVQTNFLNGKQSDHGAIIKLNKNLTGYEFDYIIATDYGDGSNQIEIDNKNNLHYIGGIGFSDKCISDLGFTSSFFGFIEAEIIAGDLAYLIFDLDNPAQNYLMNVGSDYEDLIMTDGGDFIPRKNNHHSIQLLNDEIYIVDNTGPEFYVSPNFKSDASQLAIQQSYFGGGRSDGYVSVFHSPNIPNNTIQDFDLNTQFCTNSYIHQNNGPVVGSSAAWQIGDGSDPTHVFPEIYLDGVLQTQDIPDEDFYQWQKSYDGSSWEDIPGAVLRDYDPISEAQEGIVYYRRAANICCVGPSYSNVVSANIVGSNDLVISDGDERYFHCPDTETPINISIQGGSGNLSWQWYNGYAETTDIIPASGTGSSIPASISTDAIYGGIYRLVVTDNETGCAVEELVTVFVPSISIASTSSICPEESFVTLSPNIINDDITYTWTGSNGFNHTGPSIQVTAGGSYFITADNCAFTTKEVVVSNEPHDPLLVALPDYTFCQGDQMEIGISGAEPEGYNFQWSPVTNIRTSGTNIGVLKEYTPIYRALEVPEPNPLEYTFSAIRESDGCIFETTSSITVNELANARLDNVDDSFCDGQGVFSPGSSTGEYFQWTITSTDFPGGISALQNDPSFSFNGTNSLSVIANMPLLTYPSSDYNITVELNAAFAPFPNDCFDTETKTYYLDADCGNGSGSSGGCQNLIVTDLTKGTDGYCSGPGAIFSAKEFLNATYSWSITEIDGMEQNPPLAPTGLFEVNSLGNQGNALSGTSNHPFEIIANIDDPSVNLQANFVEYTVTVQLSSGSVCTGGFTIFSNEGDFAPIVDLINGNEICFVPNGNLISGNAFPLQLDGTYFNEAPNSNILWSWSGENISNADSPFPTLNGSSDNIYTATGTDPQSNCSDSDDIVFDVYTIDLNAGSDITNICKGTVVQLDATDGPDYELDWSPAIGLNFPLGTPNSMSPTPYVNVDQQITYTLTATSTNNICVVTDQLEILPTTDSPLGLSTQFYDVCINDHVDIELADAFLSSCTGCDYSWSVVSGTGASLSSTSIAQPTIQIEYNASSTIQLRLVADKGQCGSVSGDFIFNVLNPDIPVLVDNLEIDCSIPLSGLTIQNFDPNLSYQWGPAHLLENIYLNPDATIAIGDNPISQATIYPYTGNIMDLHVVAINGGCLSQPTEVTVINTDGFDVDAGQDVSVCATLGSITIGSSNNPNDAVYQWEAIGISNDPLNISYSTPSAAEASQMLAWIVDPTARVTFFQQSGASQAGSFRYRLRATIGNCSVTDIVEITVYQPVFQSFVNGTLNVCQGDCFTLLDYQENEYNFEWSVYPQSEYGSIDDPNDPNTEFCPNNDVVYSLFAIDRATGCYGPQEIVSVFLEDAIIIPDMESEVCDYNNIVDLRSYYPHYNTYSNPTWEIKDLSYVVADPTSFEILENITFILSVVNDNGCISQSELTLEYEECPCDNIVMDFDGVNDNISMLGIGTQTDFTISMWFKSDIENGPGADRLFSFGNDAQLSIGINTFGNLWRLDQNGIVNSSQVNYNNQFVRDGQWHHMAIVAENNIRTLYIDHLVVDLWESSSLVYGPDLRFGSWSLGPVGGSLYTGQMDNIKGFDIAMSQEQLCAETNNSDPSSNPNLRIYFDFEEGVPYGDNSSLSSISNLGDLQNGLLENFILNKDFSNFICSDALEGCDPCEFDQTDPILQCLGISGIETINPSGLVIVDEDRLNFTVVEDCNYTVDFSPKTFDCDDLGNPELVIFVTDENGNSTSCQTSILIVDDNDVCPCLDDQDPPIVNCSQLSIEVDLGPSGTAFIQYSDWDVDAFDACGPVTQPSFTYTADCDDIGTNLSWPIQIFDQNGNFEWCNLSALISDPLDYCNPCLNDTEPPVVSNCPTSIQQVEIPVDGMGFFNAFSIGFLVDDNCAATFPDNFVQFDCAQLGEVNQTSFTFFDPSQNETTCVYQWQVVDPNNYCECLMDTEPPTVQCDVNAATIELGPNGQYLITIDEWDITIDDNCTDNIALPIVNFDANCPDVGEIIEWNFTIQDEAGNSTACMLSAFITDPNQYCEPCCPYDEIQETLQQDLFIEKNSCILSFTSQLFEDCTQLVVNYNDIDEITYSGGSSWEYEFEESGEYTLCVEATNFDSNNGICAQGNYCFDVCIVCENPCEEKVLIFEEIVQANSSINHSNPSGPSPLSLQERGNIQKRGDVFIDGETIYTTSSRAGSEFIETDVMVWKGTDPNPIITISGENLEQVSELQVDNSFIYVTGITYSDNINFGSTYTVISNGAVGFAEGTPQGNAFVAKYDKITFDVVWAFTINGSWNGNVEDITLLGDGGFAITGVTNNHLDFDPSPNRTRMAIDQGAGSKAYVAKYSDTNNDLFPTCDWVNTVYTSSQQLSDSRGYGIESDDSGIYVSGSSRSYFNSGLTTLNVSNVMGHIWVENFIANAETGWVLKFDKDSGNLVWSYVIPYDKTRPFDIAMDGSSLVYAGRQITGKLNKTTGAVALEQFVPNLDFYELDIQDDQYYMIGYLNGTGNYGILNDGPAVQDQLSVHMLVCNPNFGFIKSLSPGYGNESFFGHSIDVEGEKIVLGIEAVGEASGRLFYPEYPRNLEHPNNIGAHDYLSVEYYCGCENPNNPECCDDFATIIQETPDDDFCCSLTIQNNHPFEVSKIVVTSNQGDFSSILLNSSVGFNISQIENQKIEISHNSGMIPQGQFIGLLEYCNDFEGQTDYTIEYFESTLNNEHLNVCIDVIEANCYTSVITECAEVSTVVPGCTADNPDANLIGGLITLLNGNQNFDEIHFSPLTPGFSLRDCANLGPLTTNLVIQQNLSNDQNYCLEIISQSGFDAGDVFELSITLVNTSTGITCPLENVQYSLVQCCDTCDEFNASIEEISDCCFSLSISNHCFNGILNSVSINSPVGEYVNINSDDINWFNCTQNNNEICLEPNSQLQPSINYSDIVSFCISPDDGQIQQALLEASFTSIRNVPFQCAKQFDLNCEEECISEGFSSAVLITLGSSNYFVSLNCDDPFISIPCIQNDDAWIVGNFDCSDLCNSNMEINLIHNNNSTVLTTDYEQSGHWQLLLTDYIQDPGQYQLLINGSCNNSVETCFYSFEVQDNCDACRCDDLENNANLGFDIEFYSGCNRGFVPNNLKDCDMVNWSVDGVNYATLSGSEIFDFTLDSNGSSSEICMEITRLDDFDNTCSFALCQTINYSCDFENQILFECTDEIIKNGNFEEGTQGSVQLNSDATIDNWKVENGNVWYYKENGPLEPGNGFIQFQRDYLDSIKINTALESLQEVSISSEENKLLLNFMLKSSIGSPLIPLQVRVVSSETNEVYGAVNIPNGKSNIWEAQTVEILLPDNFDLDLDYDFQIYSACCIGGQDDTEDDIPPAVYSIDNLCSQFLEKVSSVENIGDYDVKIYPNPTSNEIFIKSTDMNIKGLKIIDAVGSLILDNTFDQKNILINSIDWNDGIYLVHIKFKDGKEVVHKVVKTR